jgi:hypothetical protein
MACRDSHRMSKDRMSGLGIIFSFIVIGALVPISADAQTVTTDTFCGALKEIIRHTKNDFSSFRESAIGTTEWTPKLVLPGQQRCYIQKTKGISYICESARLPTLERAAALSEENLRRAKECLGRLWKPNTSFVDSFVGLSDADNEQSIIFSTEKDSPYPRYFALVRINRMYQQPLEPDAKPANALMRRSYCGELSKVVRSGQTNFSELTESSNLNRVGTRNHWQLREPLPGWQDCYVHGDDDKPQCRYMSCTVGPMTTRAEAEKLRDIVAMEVKTCLGADWAAGATRRTDGVLATRITGRSATAYVEAAPSKSLYSEAWNLDLSVRLDVCK